jgi:hypothetical protein
LSRRCSCLHEFLRINLKRKLQSYALILLSLKERLNKREYRLNKRQYQLNKQMESPRSSQRAAVNPSTAIPQSGARAMKRQYRLNKWQYRNKLIRATYKVSP